MKQIRTIIIEGTESGQTEISHLVNEHPNLTLVGTYRSLIKAHQIILSEQVDLMLLDIDLTKIKGLDFVRHLINPPLVIFISSKRDFAVESYELNAVDYLLKPYTLERFLQAIEKVSMRWQKKDAKPFFFKRQQPLFKG